MKIQNEASFRKYATSGITLFLGAGFSVGAKNSAAKKLPVGDELRDRICLDFALPQYASMSLPAVSQLVNTIDPEKLKNYLTSIYTVSEANPLYQNVKKLNIEKIFTTNIDNLVNLIYDRDEWRYINDLRLRGASYRDRSAIDYLALHGSVTHPEPNYTFTAIEISSAFQANPTQFQYLVKSISDSSMLFWGYGLHDAGTLASMNPHYRSGPDTKPRWIVLRQPSDGEIDYFKSLGFLIIEADTFEMLEYLGGIDSTYATISTNGPTSKDFLSGQIPELSSIPVRSFDDYFHGSAPSWYEVLTNRIPITQHYTELTNLIDEGRNVMVVGIPACGKSTLLMQAAANYDTKAIKLYENRITIEKARNICAKLSKGGKVIVFLDAMSDSIDGLDVLTSCSSVQVIGADRSTNIAFGSHLFASERFARLDCTELPTQDRRKIYEVIPPNIRSHVQSIPTVTEVDSEPSIFEYIQENVIGKRLKERYVDVLSELKRKNLKMHDLFVMVSYVFSCNAPVSFDVVSRFMRTGGDYIKVYSAIDDLGKLLNNTDACGETFVDLDDTQDHFVPRSTIIADTVIEMCNGADFGRVFKDFHSNVSRIFIPNYATFKRYGYRNQYVEKAFPDYKNGEQFYLQAIKEDSTYFLKQQLAIYLGGKKQYSLAFKYIDDALIESRGRNQNIRHTHARLLFDANIDKASENRELRIDLRKSMEILESCHNYDKRQTNHSQRFAEQSIRYWNVFGDDESRDYMIKAKGWLNEEIDRLPSLRYAKKLRRDISKFLN